MGHQNFRIARIFHVNAATLRPGSTAIPDGRAFRGTQRMTSHGNAAPFGMKDL